MRGWPVLAGWGLAAAALAAPVDFDKRYPAGSIRTEAAAQQALQDAAAARQQIDERYRTDSARCAHVFLATECQDNARRARTQGETQVHRVEVEAHDLQRQVAAQRRAQQRDAEQAQWQKQEAVRPVREQEARKSASQRADRAQEQAQEALRQQAQAAANRERYQQRNAQHRQDEDQRASVQLRNAADNERRYEEKQAQAKAYAASRAREREENRKAREERARKRNAQMPQPDSGAPAEPQK